MEKQSCITIGLIADTHIPDRVNELHPEVASTFRNAEVDLIFHAGDICIPLVLNELEKIAPVHAVRGNRDWAFTNILGWINQIEVVGIQVALIHGHGNLQSYLKTKYLSIVEGYKLEQYIPELLAIEGKPKVTVFGHTHCPEIIWKDDRLFINPGSASTISPDSSISHQSVGILRVDWDGQIQAEIVKLMGWSIKKRRWVEILED